MVDTATAPAPVAFSLDQLTDTSEYLGVITVDESVQGDYGPQWHYCIRPVDYDLGGKTGVYHQYSETDKLTSKSKFGKILTAFVKVMGAGAVKAVGGGELVGAVMWFKEYEVKQGKDRQTGESMTWTYTAPFKQATEEEKARAKAKMETAGVQVNTFDTPVSANTPEEIEAMVAVLDGQSEAQAQVAAARSKLPANLKAPLLSGNGITALINAGHIKIEAGTYRRV